MKKHPADGAHARPPITAKHDGGGKPCLEILRFRLIEGYKFRRQVPIGRYIADFICHEARLIIDIDGGQHSRSSQREAERSGFLQNEGYRILPFWNDEVLANLDGVHQTIADGLGRITPTQPSPIEGEGFTMSLAVERRRHDDPSARPLRLRSDQ